MKFNQFGQDHQKKISDEEYKGFYKAISKEFEDPLAYAHFKAEGSVEFKSIIYIPGKSPSDLFNFDKQLQGLQLFVRKVFITDRMKEHIPRYLNFIKGVIDSEDLPLHISRQELQRSSYLNMIKNKIVGRILKLLKDLAEEEVEENKEVEPKEGEEKKEVVKKGRYSKFWKEFGKNVRLGVVEDDKNRKELIELLRFYSTNNETQLTSLKDYISRMKTNQKHIYYITGESVELAKKSPFIEQLYERGFEVLYFVDTIDEYLLNHLSDYEGKKLVSVNKEGLEFGDEDSTKEQKEKDTKSFTKLISYLQKELNDKNINQVKISNRLKNSPCVVVSTAQGVSANMERILKAQALAGGSNPQIEYMLKQPRIFEINPEHPVIIELNKRVESDEKDETSKQITQLLFETASLRSGYSIENTDLFADRIFAMMKKGMEKSKKSEVIEPKDEL